MRPTDRPTDRPTGRPTFAVPKVPAARRTLDNPVTIGLGLVVALLLLVAGLNYRNTRQLNEDARWVAHLRQGIDLRRKSAEEASA